MAKKQNSMLKAVTTGAVKGPTRKPAAKPTSDGRSGKKLVGGHFDPEVAKALKLIAVEDDTTVQALLGEALTLLFKKKNIKVVVE